MPECLDPPCRIGPPCDRGCVADSSWATALPIAWKLPDGIELARRGSRRRLWPGRTDVRRRDRPFPLTIPADSQTDSSLTLRGAGNVTNSTPTPSVGAPRQAAATSPINQVDRAATDRLTPSFLMGANVRDDPERGRGGDRVIDPGRPTSEWRAPTFRRFRPGAPTGVSTWRSPGGILADFLSTRVAQRTSSIAPPTPTAGAPRQAAATSPINRDIRAALGRSAVSLLASRTRRSEPKGGRRGQCRDRCRRSPSLRRSGRARSG